jgi:hypothetical protein
LAGSNSDLDDSRNDHRLGIQLSLHKTLKVNPEVFLEDGAVGDLLGFHFGYGLRHGGFSFGRKAI